MPPCLTGNHLLPAGDAGDSLSVTTSIDLAENPRVMGDAVDMGAYEVEQTALAVSGADIYEDIDLAAAGITAGNEPNLHAYHYVGSPVWDEYSVVDTVTASDVADFGIWGWASPKISRQP